MTEKDVRRAAEPERPMDDRVAAVVEFLGTVVLVILCGFVLASYAGKL